MYEYTGTAWITVSRQQQADHRPDEAVAGGTGRGPEERPDLAAPSALNNTYALAMNQANFEKYGTKTLSDVAD
ncbi:hypothetical protein ACRAWF_10350 [Streptomyces sp. L7]